MHNALVGSHSSRGAEARAEPTLELALIKLEKIILLLISTPFYDLFLRYPLMARRMASIRS